MTADGQPYGIALGQVQHVLLDGQKFPLPGGPADPDGAAAYFGPTQVGADAISTTAVNDG